MKFRGEAVPDRNARKLGQQPYDPLPVTSILDSVIHSSQHTGGILDGLFFAHLRTGRTQVGHLCALIMGRHLESATSTGRILLEQQHDILTCQQFLFLTEILVGLEPRGQIQHVGNFIGREVEQRQQVSFSQINHGVVAI